MLDKQILADMLKHTTSLTLDQTTEITLFEYIHHNYPLRKEVTEILALLAAVFDKFYFITHTL